ncbi:phage resistance protein [[Pantoea] beijingensis]|uniref:cyclic-guanylate-specific phosphodiesterase n=1 Tax=[Pantoea] beijingensis TaxID=1324864 RepID=A0A443IF39_9GAMM|nr:MULTISPECIES: cyclic di-GMP phosphodiesterase [Erwiniaceae]RWR02661.1 phage resistance protein [[Pantoea] beijingensis]
MAATKITHHAANPRKIALLSAGVGFIFFLLFISISLTLTFHQRTQQHDRLVLASRDNLINGFDSLRKVLEPLRDSARLPCSAINAELTSRAAFTRSIRAILLVRDGNAYCSSATGAFSLSAMQISPQTNLDKALDLTLIAGTPMQPSTPAMVLWRRAVLPEKTGVLTTLNIDLTPYLLLASRQQEISGMAIRIGNNALTTWDSHVISTSKLPKQPLRTFTLQDYDFTFIIYGSTFHPHEVYILLLVGALCAVLIASLSFMLLTLHLRPGKAMLLGMKRGQFHVEYQPVIDAASGLTSGFEALLRWTHPTEGHIPPDAFIRYAEGQKLIVPLTQHLFKLVARDAHRLRNILPPGLKMGINISPNHLSSATFHHDVKTWLTTMPSGYFNYVFEITERTMVSERNAGEIFDWIHNQGIEIAIDDFGTGHSALIYLEKFTFDYLKIDRGFVQSIGMETVTSPVLDTVLNLAKKLNLKTIAEGVETREQAGWLINHDVTQLQGYFYSAPMTVSQLIDSFQTR